MPTWITAEEAFRQLAEGLGDSGAADFFDTLVERLARLLWADHVLIARVRAGEARTLAVWSRGQHRDNVRYPLAGTPCEQVAGRTSCLYASDVQSRFPHDALLRELVAESYLGMPLCAPDGAPLGLIAVLADRPMAPSDQERELLQIAATQAGAELSRREAERALQASERHARESERRLDTLLNHLPGMAYRCLNDANWSMLLVSQGAEALTGHTAEALTHNRHVSYAELIHPDDRQGVDDTVQKAIARNEPFQVVYRLRTAEGQLRWMWEQGQAVFDDEGRVKCLEGFITDVTERQEAQRVQQAVMQVASTVTSRIGDDYFHQLVETLIQLLEADAGFIAMLETGGDTTTATSQRADDLRLSLVSAQTDRERLERYDLPLSDTPCARLIDEQEIMIHDDADPGLPGFPAATRAWIGRRLDNARSEPIGVLVLVYRQPLEADAFATSVLRILSTGAAAELERRSDQRRMHQLAYTDGTTGLPNRIRFMEDLSHQRRAAEREQTPLALLLLDIRRFKEINDIHGHQVGDRLLAALAERLQHALAPHERLARLSNDEFALLVPRAAEKGLAECLERIRRTASQPITLGHRRFTLAVSIGTAHYPSDAMTSEELFKFASIALYHAKQRDEGICSFDATMTRDLARRQQMTERLQLALAEDRLSLHYQPKVDLASGRLMGAEALCRWHDEEWGWVSPGEFIPLAEERGLIRPLGDWVLAEAARQLDDWRRNGRILPERLSVNVSAQQFTDPDLARRIAELTRHTPASSIDLELTESDVMRDAEQAIDITHSLHRAGYTLSIDDFGTGYSSLAYLRRFAADTLKIDISFVRRMLDGPHDHAIVETIIAMARSLGLRTVAEGVETREQALELARLGCDQAQGYYFGHPLPAEEFAAAWGEAMAAESITG
ncbi:EAL domain-containing protein [Halomonas sp. SL1]|uniref:EAL domain-containing protein n=1 Tax=Halomonas sp. SL1 TaxID=2137478 RepID=UPI000D163AB8|nr:EAL domain-containing protein [Halomonas sp. SL1]RAH36592.1 EAL domain-containing protein [Halomonas sp. SL1]